MNVLIITDLYPEHQHHSVKYISWAVHELIVGLSRFGIHVKKVIRPISEIKWRSIEREKVFNTYIIDNIKVETKSFINIPKQGWFLRKNDLRYLETSIQDIDLIIAHMAKGASLANEIKKRFNKEFIYIVHNNDLRTLEKQKNIIKNAKNIYARSWALNQKLNEYGIYSEGIVFSGIAKELIIETEVKNIDQKKKLQIIGVHRLQKLKNIDITLKALSQLPPEYNWEYTIIGDGEEYENINSLIKELNLKDHVKLLGFKERLFCIEKMKKSDVFVMPSAPETFGLAYLEAMASGCIVVGSKGWGVDGLIEDGFNGYLVEPRNIEELKEVFIKILTTNQVQILENSRKTIKIYTMEDAQKNYANFLKCNFSSK